MTPFSLMSFLAAVAGVALGVFIHARNPKRSLNRLYLLVCLSAAFYLFVESGYRQSASF